MSWNHKLSLITIWRQFQLQRKIFLYLILVLPTLAAIGIIGCCSWLEKQMVLSLASILMVTLSSTVAFLIADSIRRLPKIGRAIAKNNLEWVADERKIPELEVPSAHYQTVSLIEAIARLDAVNQELEGRITNLNRELHSAKVEVEIAEQVKNNFLSEMSDRLRTPLNAILGMTQIMQQEPETTRSQQADLDLIHRNSQHLVTAIDKMLMRGRLEVRQTCLEPSFHHPTGNDPDVISAYFTARSIIEPTALQIMPQEWLIQVEQAASELDQEAIASLLDSIPDEHTYLAEALQSKIDNFDFDEITDLVRLVRR